MCQGPERTEHSMRNDETQCGAAGIWSMSRETVGSKGFLRGCIESSVPYGGFTDGGVKHGLEGP